MITVDVLTIIKFDMVDNISKIVHACVELYHWLWPGYYMYIHVYL